jgi:hypothetical protein
MVKFITKPGQEDKLTLLLVEKLAQALVKKILQ